MPLRLILYDVAASEDKDFVVIEGATHGVIPCTACETSPGQYSNTVNNFSTMWRTGSTRGSELVTLQSGSEQHQQAGGLDR